MGSLTIDPSRFDAAIFDLDGVLTDTARVHAAAWKTVFDSFLQARARQEGLAFQPFDIQSDYLAYVDGRPRYDGVRSFLGSRGIRLAEGSEADGESSDTVRALGERKAKLFRRALQEGIKPAAGAEALLSKLRKAGIRTAVGSSSKHAGAILRAAGLAHHLDVCVDGLEAETLGLEGKPDPALFLEITRRLGVQPSRALLFEDALAGVEAGKRGGFGCVVGIYHGQDREALREHGADVVIEDLGEVTVKQG